ncbi:CRISPR-associated endonuclease Cas3'' [Xanthobacter sp. V3C-3]|uniref:CRISPR-associated endonuclease Cas3'' n=1 Tax=Xanthobacter lutulentifluminis TaxID=3119935 RepID=UPI003726C5A6
MAEAYAHSVPGAPVGRWETLRDHHEAVGALAAELGACLGWAEVARLAGRLHDIGKLSPEFQAYIAGDRASGGDHSSAGARIALDHYGPTFGTVLAAVIAAHHAGLADGDDLARRMAGAAKLIPADWQAHTGPLPDMAALRPSRPLPAGGPKGFALSFLVRMLFSCLVDADFIATEAFYAKATDAEAARGGHTDLATLRARLTAHMAALGAGAPESPLNALRAAILRHALDKAALAPGLFSLTVPTGGGKTLTSLAFALDHAVRHGLRRIIFVIPYTGAWIETSSWGPAAPSTPCRPPHGGVDRNYSEKAFESGIPRSPPARCQSAWKPDTLSAPNVDPCLGH